MTDAEFQRYVDSLPDDLDQFNAALAGLSEADQAAFNARVLAEMQGGPVQQDSVLGAGGWGLGQGLANLANGVQDSVIGILNLPAMGVNGIAWAEEKLGILPEDSIRAPYIPSPDWSKDLVVPEGQFAHDASKFLAPLAVEGWLSGKIVKFVKPLLTKVPLRQHYIEAVGKLADEAASLREAGKSSEEIARTLHVMRRELGVRFKNLTPPDKLERIYARNLEKYGDKLGPTIDWLRSHGKSWEDIIESASRPGGGDLGY